MTFNIPYKRINPEDEIAIKKSIVVFYYTISRLPESYTTINKRKELISEWEPLYKGVKKLIFFRKNELYKVVKKFSEEFLYVKLNLLQQCCYKYERRQIYGE